MIHAHHVNVYKEGVHILKDLSFHIHRGENVAILGPNGAGKSTLLQLLCRELYPVYDPDCAFSLFGQTQWDLWTLRRKMGIVSMALQHEVPDTLSAEQLVYSGFQSVLDPRALREPTCEEKEIAESMIHLARVTPFRTRSMPSLSSGEQRRALLARALVHHPQLLVFDEPTANLDIQMAFSYLSIMRECIHQGVSVVLVTHHLHEIPPEIDRVLFLKKGRIIADGSKAELLTEPHLEALFETPLELHERRGFYHVYPKD